MKTQARRAEKPARVDRWEIRSAGDWIVHDQIMAAMQDYDRALFEAERVWGVDRLPLLVSQETRLKWWRAVDALNAASAAGDAQKVQALCANLTKGLARLIEEAQALGHRPLEPDVWETPLPDGRKLRIVRTWPERAQKVEPEDGVVTYTLEEVGRLLNSKSILGAIKTAWPGATVTEVRAKAGDLNDDIPF